MNKKELVDYVKDDMGCTRKEAEMAVASVLSGIVTGLISESKVSLTGFGIFTAVDKPARTARNPKTGETVDVEAKRVPRFKPSATFKEVINSSGE